MFNCPIDIDSSYSVNNVLFIFSIVRRLIILVPKYEFNNNFVILDTDFPYLELELFRLGSHDF
jgi:hypothetical protein